MAFLSKYTWPSFVYRLNDFPNFFERTTPRIFLTILTRVGATDEVQEWASIDMMNVHRWLCTNKLSLTVHVSVLIQKQSIARYKTNKSHTYQGPVV